MCVHMLVCKSLPPLRTMDEEAMFYCLFTVCYPSLFCLRQLHRNTELCSALFFAFSSSVYFFLFPPFCYLDAELGFILACEGDFSGPAMWQCLSGCPPHVQGHTGRRRQPQCPTALMLPDSCACIQEARSEQEPVSSCAFISGSLVKNKAFQHIKYPFGKQEQKVPSPSCVSGCSGQALGEPLPHSSSQLKAVVCGCLY